MHYTLEMCRLFRIALMWLVAVAVPIQGAVAATMLTCGPNHVPASSQGLVLDGDHMSHASHTMHHQVDHVEQSSVGSSDGADLSTGDADFGKVATQKCSACASCCTAAALPSSVLDFPLSALPSTDLPTALSAAVIFSTDGPERPPRISLL
jgi:hypothetical protein